MSPVTAERVREFLLARFADSFEAVGVTAQDVPDDFDLLVEGVIDSLGILEMISSVEAEFQIDLDFDGLSAEDLTRLGPFCRYVESLS